MSSTACEAESYLIQVRKDFQDIVLAARHDDFYKRHMYSNFGDIGMAVKDLVEEFQRHSDQVWFLVCI